MASVISGDANVSATEFGYLDGVTAALQGQIDAKAALASPTFTGTPALPDGTTLAGSLLTSGKILQIVRATDSTSRTTTSTSYVDVTGMSVTITPQKLDSTILVLALYNGQGPNTASQVMDVAITDSSNNALSGAEGARLGASVAQDVSAHQTVIGTSTPATVSAVTYKMRFKTTAATSQIKNDLNTGQMFAIEVSA